MRFYSIKPHVNMWRAAYSEPAIDRMTAMKNMIQFSLIATIKLMMPIQSTSVEAQQTHQQGEACIAWVNEEMP